MTNEHHIKIDLHEGSYLITQLKKQKSYATVFDDDIRVALDEIQEFLAIEKQKRLDEMVVMIDLSTNTQFDDMIFVRKLENAQVKEIDGVCQETCDGTYTDFLTNPSVWEADLRIFGRSVSNPPVGQSVKIVWIAAGQQVFSFNPDVYPDNANNVTDPIIEVMTASNSAGLDKASSINGGLSASLKIALADNDTAKTYEKHLPLLQELGLDDNVRQLVTLDDAILSIMQEIDHALYRQLFEIAMILALFLILVFQSVPLLSDLDAKRSAIKRIYGYPFASRQKLFFVIFGLVWAGIFVITVVFNSFLGWPNGLSSQDAGVMLSVAAFGFVAETVVSAVALFFTERRRTTDVLKGES